LVKIPHGGFTPATERFIIMKFILRVSAWIDGLNEWVGRGTAWVSLALVAVVFTDVVMRYAFNKSFVFVQELEWHTFAFVFLIGAGYTLLYDGHVRVDIFYQRLGPKGKAWINLLGVLLFLIPGCLMIIKTSWHFVLRAFEVGEGSPDPGGIPYRFFVKGLIPVGFSLLLLQGISMGIHSLLQVLNIEKPEERAH
jgi:TRAP-type mannitol/chloroaromatic compound transport system permease small subunit